MMGMVFFYIATVVLANLGFSYIPMIPLPGGEMFAPMSLLVGFIFVLRDFAQKAIGHKIFIAMFVGVAVSYLLADPFVAIASATAFAISEVIDWAVYSFSNRSLKDRILLSSAISVPIDSVVFMLMVGFFTWYGFAIMVASKMLGAYLVWRKL
jgi:uncharacterized PurR-regulated membrane protein YhhQ (DUF165 family)